MNIRFLSLEKIINFLLRRLFGLENYQHNSYQLPFADMFDLVDRSKCFMIEYNGSFFLPQNCAHSNS